MVCRRLSVAASALSTDGSRCRSNGPSRCAYTVIRRPPPPAGRRVTPRSVSLPQFSRSARRAVVSQAVSCAAGAVSVRHSSASTSAPNPSSRGPPWASASSVRSSSSRKATVRVPSGSCRTPIVPGIQRGSRDGRGGTGGTVAGDGRPVASAAPAGDSARLPADAGPTWSGAKPPSGSRTTHHTGSSAAGRPPSGTSVGNSTGSTCRVASHHWSRSGASTLSHNSGRPIAARIRSGWRRARSARISSATARLPAASSAASCRSPAVASASSSSPAARQARTSAGRSGWPGRSAPNADSSTSSMSRLGTGGVVSSAIRVPARAARLTARWRRIIRPASVPVSTPGGRSTPGGNATPWSRAPTRMACNRSGTPSTSRAVGWPARGSGVPVSSDKPVGAGESVPRDESVGEVARVGLPGSAAEPAAECGDTDGEPLAENATGSGSGSDRLAAGRCGELTTGDGASGTGTMPT